ncbi:MAG: alpha/beta hydrolase family esterase [Gammaproteobacteria bacterium]
MNISNRLIRFFLLVMATLLLASCHDSDSDDGHGGEEPLATGLQTIQSGEDEREFYLQIPEEANGDIARIQASAETHPPLLFTYHGYTGSWENWLGPNRFYDLADVVGNEAIIVSPNGLPNAAGQRVWGGAKDRVFFLDMLAELDRRGLQYDANRVFVVGHSNGAGFTHELGCAFGDIIRGIATAAGSLTGTECIGSLGALLMEGSNDPLASGGLAEVGLNYWVLYNGWDPDQSVPAYEGLCDDYSFPGELNSPYPVLWCEHLQGHSWPDYGSETVWDFFNGFADVAPTPDFPDGGGAERATPPADTTLSLQIEAPVEMNRPLRGVATLRPTSWLTEPGCSAPAVILGNFAVDGLVIPGRVSDLIEIPITYFVFGGDVTFPSDWALSITVYVEGGSDGVIPTPDVDYDLSYPLTVTARETPVVIPEVLTLVPVPDLCGFGG